MGKKSNIETVVAEICVGKSSESMVMESYS